MPTKPLWTQDYREPFFEALLDIPEVWPEDAPLKPSAVLCLLLPPPSGEDTLHVLLTRRSAFVNSHRGQIGFPGGRREPSDRSPLDTALRETYEEVGIPPSAITITGALPPVKALDLHPVVPLVGYAALRPEDCECNPAEVAEVFSLPWTLFTPDQRRSIRFNIFGRWRETVVYQAESYAIWGLTAMMLTRARMVAP